MSRAQLPSITLKLRKHDGKTRKEIIFIYDFAQVRFLVPPLPHGVVHVALGDLFPCRKPPSVC